MRPIVTQGDRRRRADGDRRRRRRLAVDARSTISSARDTVFAFLPLGTANSFARTLGIPLDLDGAIDVIANGVARRIDLGCIDGDYFANAAAMGLSPLIAETVPHKLKKYLGMARLCAVGGRGSRSSSGRSG